MRAVSSLPNFRYVSSGSQNYFLCWPISAISFCWTSRPAYQYLRLCVNRSIFEIQRYYQMTAVSGTLLWYLIIYSCLYKLRNIEVCLVELLNYQTICIIIFIVDGIVRPVVSVSGFIKYNYYWNLRFLI